MIKEQGIRLEFSDGRQTLSSLTEINKAFQEIGSRIWPLDLRAEPHDIKKLLNKPTLTTEESDRLLNHFLLSRERLLEIIISAGREAHVPGGGFVNHHRSPNGEILSLYVDCPGEDTGWILTYDGGYPHVGSISGAQPGTKALVQVIGPETWVMRYDV